MVIGNTFGFEPDLSMRKDEIRLKELCGRHPGRRLDLPHTQNEIRDIHEEIKRALQDTPQEALNMQLLDESSYFDEGSDVEIYQHLRYLPATWHTHDFIEIACVVRGECVNYFRDGEVRMRAGDVCILAPNTQHTVSAFADDCLLYNIILRASTFQTAFFGVMNDSDILSEFFTRLLYQSKGHPYLLFKTGGDRELLDCIGQAIREFARNRQYRNRMMVAIINAFFIILLRNHGADVVLPATNRDAGNENTVLILKYMQSHYATISLPQLASFFNYSERQVQRIIKAATGQGFHENILKMKLAQADRLLKNTDLPVQEIASRLGYSDVAGFRQTFKKARGVTPAEFRKQ